MSNWHRIIWIDGRVRASAYPNCRGIAEHFEISARQAARDVEYLRDRLDAPLAYSHTRKGYYYTEQTFVLPAMLLTDAEIRNLSYLSYCYQKTGGREELQMAELLARLTHGKGLMEAAADGQSKVAVHHLSQTVTDKFGKLQQAIRLQIKVSLVYYSDGGQIKVDYFSPIQLFPYDTEHYLMGFDESTGQIRLIALKLITDIRLQGQRYAISSLVGNHEVIPIAAEEPYSAVVSFSVPEYVCLLQHRYEQIEGRSFRIHFRDVERFSSALLGCLCDYRIEKPGWLRNMVRNRLVKMLQAL